jgi:hypothetical protein
LVNAGFATHRPKTCLARFRHLLCFHYNGQCRTLSSRQAGWTKVRPKELSALPEEIVSRRGLAGMKSIDD